MNEVVTAKYKLNTMKISIPLNGYVKRNVCPFSFPSRSVSSQKVTFSRVPYKKKNSVLKSNHKERLAAITSTRRTDQISWPFHFRQSLSVVEREFKIRRLRTTTTVKHATAHVQNHVTVHFSRVVLRLR